MQIILLPLVAFLRGHDAAIVGLEEPRLNQLVEMKRGQAAAQYRLGSIGDGTKTGPDSNVDAYMWLTLASQRAKDKVRTDAQQAIRRYEKDYDAESKRLDELGLSRTGTAVRGAADNPMSEAELVGKFRECAAWGGVGEARAQRALDWLLALERQPSVAGLVANLVADAEVLFDGIPAPVFYAQASQVTVQAPYSLNGAAATVVEARYRKVSRGKLTLPVSASTAHSVANVRRTPAQMLDKHYLKSRAKLINPKKAQDFGPGTPKDGGTIYLGTADASGMMVSLIQSNYTGFGSGIVVPGTGVSLHNRGHGFSVDPAHPNCVAPGKRPFHTIIPAFLSRDGEPQMSFGVMGGNMQPQGHMQTLVRMIDHAQNPQTACDAPRWRFNTGLEINAEPTMPAATVQGLKERGHQIAVINDSYQDFGAGQFIWRMGDPKVQGYVAASDPRRDGQAVGF